LVGSQELGVPHVVVADLPDASKLKWLRQQAEAKGAGVPGSRWFMGIYRDIYQYVDDVDG
jgi:hypothetical protein